jgi:hypothetical protein
MAKTICPKCGTEKAPESFHDGAWACSVCDYIGYYDKWLDNKPVVKEPTDYEKLDSFKELEMGWDGYSASPPKEEDIELAKKFLKIISTEKPFVTITGDGVPFFEWDNMVIEVKADKNSEDHILGTIFTGDENGL